MCAFSCTLYHTVYIMWKTHMPFKALKILSWSGLRAFKALKLLSWSGLRGTRSSCSNIALQQCFRCKVFVVHLVTVRGGPGLQALGMLANWPVHAAQSCMMRLRAGGWPSMKLGLEGIGWLLLLMLFSRRWHLALRPPAHDHISGLRDHARARPVARINSCG